MKKKKPLDIFKISFVSVFALFMALSLAHLFQVVQSENNYLNPFSADSANQFGYVLGTSTTALGTSLPTNSVPTTGANLNTQFLIDAQKYLGCNTYQSCAAFCNMVSNHSKCEEFSKAEGLMAGTTSVASPSSTAINDYGRVDCSKLENAAKCKTLGAVCGSFCKINPTLCASVVPSPRPATGSALFRK